MSLRLKIMLSLMLLAFAATSAVGVSSYVGSRDELQAVVDRSLDTTARRLAVVFDRGGPLTVLSALDLPGIAPRPGTLGPDRDLERVLVQVISSRGEVLLAPNSGELPVDANDLQIAAEGAPSMLRRNATIDGESFRILTVPVPGGALQLARSLAEIEQATDAIRDRTLVTGVVVLALACLLGWLIGRQVTRRLTRLTESASEVAATGRLDVEVPVSGTDETGRLGVAFNEMLGALALSEAAQHQLVQDAGHELRTPLTSLRTNVAVLRQYEALDATQRQQIVADLDSETRELTSLVNELVELATDRRDDEAPRRVDLGIIAEQAAGRVRRRTGRVVTVDVDDSLVVARPNALDRAVHNLIDNAAKFSADATIEVVVRAGRLTVNDRGPGIAAADLARVFDRFYRAAGARSSPGSGLGLAIVKEIIEAHGGTVFAAARDGGGAAVGFTLPVQL